MYNHPHSFGGHYSHPQGSSHYQGHPAGAQRTFQTHFDYGSRNRHPQQMPPQPSFDQGFNSEFFNDRYSGFQSQVPDRFGDRFEHRFHEADSRFGERFGDRMHGLHQGHHSSFDPDFFEHSSRIASDVTRAHQRRVQAMQEELNRAYQADIEKAQEELHRGSYQRSIGSQGSFERSPALSSGKLRHKFDFSPVESPNCVQESKTVIKKTRRFPGPNGQDIIEVTEETYDIPPDHPDSPIHRHKEATYQVPHSESFNFGSLGSLEPQETKALPPSPDRDIFEETRRRLLVSGGSSPIRNFPSQVPIPLGQGSPLPRGSPQGFRTFVEDVQSGYGGTGSSGKTFGGITPKAVPGRGINTGIEINPVHPGMPTGIPTGFPPGAIPNPAYLAPFSPSAAAFHRPNQLSSFTPEELQVDEQERLENEMKKSKPPLDETNVIEEVHEGEENDAQSEVGDKDPLEEFKDQDEEPNDISFSKKKEEDDKKKTPKPKNAKTSQKSPQTKE